MELGVFVIRDSRTEFMTPTFDMTEQSAMRNFEVAMGRVDSLFHTHPQDFSLYALGVFDTKTGQLVSFVQPKFLCDGLSFVKDSSSGGD